MTTWVPWWLKLGVKLGATAVRMPHAVRNQLGFDRHGSMQDPGYAIGVVHHHLAAAGQPVAPFRALELGPGDSPLGALVAASAGAAETWLIDVGPFADYRPSMHAAAHERLRLLGCDPPGPPRIETFEQYLEVLNTRYLTTGIEGLAQVPSGHIDVAWSHAVLEHVRRDQFEGLMTELRRVLRPTGAISHRVDLLDHLSGGFENLRFSSQRWERPLVWRSGAYTNRLSQAEMLETMSRAGFDVEVTSTTRRHVPAQVRRSLSAEFQARGEAELAIAGFDVVARPAG